MKAKQEEIKIILPSVMLQNLDDMINSGWFDDRNDIICYAVRRYTDDIKRINSIKKQFNE